MLQLLELIIPSTIDTWSHSQVTQDMIQGMPGLKMREYIMFCNSHSEDIAVINFYSKKLLWGNFVENKGWSPNTFSQFII